MNRTETTAEFDADGRFVLTGQTGQPASPGEHRVVVLIGESAEFSAPCRPAAEPDVCLHVDGEKLLLAVPLNPAADLSVVNWIESARRQRDASVLGAQLI